MNKPILFSWIAWGNDFLDKGKTLNPQGPNFNIHQHFYKKQNYQKHYLLTSAASVKADTGQSEKFANYLKHQFDDFKHKIELVYMDIQDIIDPEEIILKLQPLLHNHRNDEVHAFISPGTPMMQVAWVSLYMAKVIPDLKLIQGVEAAKSKSGKPEFRFREFNLSLGVKALFAKSTEAVESFDSDTKFFHAEILDPVYKKAMLAAAVPQREISVLIQGESGTGKENLAHYIHKASTRKNKKFTPVNCASISDQLLESRLFGHVKGTFTDAKEDRKGYFEDCNGGTLFLDEIGDTSPAFQQSLLRVLQDGHITRSGSTTPIKVDVKVITATHKNLKALCEEGKFRWDLYYRLATVELKLPSLRQYPKTDREGILNYLIKSRAEFFDKPLIKLSKEVRDAFIKYPFPGNIRELQHMLDRCYIFCEDDININIIPEEMTVIPVEHSWKIKDMKINLATKALRYFDYNLSHTHKELGISYNTLVTLIENENIVIPDGCNPNIKVGKKKDQRKIANAL
jgi:two-component system, NtrC family, response regulator HydG